LFFKANGQGCEQAEGEMRKVQEACLKESLAKKYTWLDGKTFSGNKFSERDVKMTLEASQTSFSWMKRHESIVTVQCCGSGIQIRDDFFSDPRSGPFYGDIFLHYLPNPCHLYEIGLLLNLPPETISSKIKVFLVIQPSLYIFVVSIVIFYCYIFVDSYPFFFVR
jgi:hypothetical protein